MGLFFSGTSVPNGSIGPLKLTFTTASVLGSGSFTSDGTANEMQIGNFSTTGDIGDGEVRLTIVAEWTSLATDMNIFIDNATGAIGAGGTAISVRSDPYVFLELVLRKSPKTPTSTYWQVVQKYGIIMDEDGGVTTKYDFSSAEQIFLKGYSSGAQTWKCQWVAYQINEA